MNDAERAAEKSIWSLIQFTENLRRQHGKEPYSMEVIFFRLGKYATSFLQLSIICISLYVHLKIQMVLWMTKKVIV
jgi:hypothetical protein